MAYTPTTWVDKETEITAQRMNNIEEGIQQALRGAGGEGGSGQPGGYYTPQVSQPDANTARFAFAPSSSDMPAVDSVSVTLPAGPQGPAYELTAADKQEIVDEVTEQAAPVSYNAQTLTDEQKAQARKNIGAATAEDQTDEELLTAGVRWESAEEANNNIIGRSIWISSGNEPYYFGGTDNRFCTRRFNVNRVPRIMFVGTNINAFIFWKDGAFVAEVKSVDMPESLNVDFEFDQVAVNFSYGYNEFVAGDVTISVAFPNTTTFSNVLVIGDSISADYYGNYTKWVTILIKEEIFPADTVNDSIHATGFVARYGSEDNDFITRIEALENKDKFDLVVVFGGINDYIQAIPMGESGGDKLTNFVPAVDYFFNYLVNNFAQARIVVLSPLRTSNVYDNTAGLRQTEYADYIKQVAKSYCLPVLNLTDESGFYPFNDTFKEMWTLIPEGYSADGVHPNAAYQEKFLAPMIKGFLLQIGGQ